MKISVFIPCIPRHFQGVGSVIREYLNGVQKPDEIIVGLSESYLISQADITCIEVAYRPFVKVISVQKRLYTGPCAQLAEFFCTGDVIVYQAADDLPSPRRIEFVDRYFTNYDIVALNHGFVGTQSPDKFKDYDWNKVKVVQPAELLKMDEENPDDVYGQKCGFPVAAGTICIRSHVLETIKWGWEPKGQDGVFCKKVLREMKKSLIIDAPLYFYSK